MSDVFIGSTVRSGGSLLARLFDHHPAVGSYPFELHLPMDPALHPSLARRGEKDQVQDFPRFGDAQSADDVLRAVGLDPDPRRCLVGAHFRGGKLRAKSRHMDVQTRFDHAAFWARLRAAVETERRTPAVYAALHRAFFETWDDGAHGGSLDFAVYHRANGLFSDVPRFLREFEGSRFIVPIRGVAACLVSEKRKTLSQLASGRIARGWRPGDRWVRFTSGRFAEATLVNWLVCVTRAALLRERLGERVIVYRYEDLVREPEATLRRIAEHVGLAWDESLLRPTNAGRDWAGNSMFGPMSGIESEAGDARGLLNQTERALVDEYAGALSRYLEMQDAGVLDFAGLERAALFDYEHQSRFFDDRDKSALYFASLYERWPRRSAWQELREALSGRPRRVFL